MNLFKLLLLLLAALIQPLIRVIRTHLNSLSINVKSKFQSQEVIFESVTKNSITQMNKKTRSNNSEK